MGKTADLQQRNAHKESLKLAEIVPKKRENEFFVSSEKKIADYVKKKLAENGITNQKFENLDNAILAVSVELAKFVKNQQNKKIVEIINAFSVMTEEIKYSASVAFKSISNPIVAKLFASNPQAFSEIAKAAGPSAQWAFYSLSNPDIAKLFASNPQTFSEIAKATGMYAGPVFDSLPDPDISKLFLSDPQKLINAFSGIINATGFTALQALHSLSNPIIAKLFVSNPQKLINAFSEIEKAAGEFAHSAFDSLLDHNISKFFVSNPQMLINAFSAIKKATGELAWAAFNSISNPEIAKFLADYCLDKINIKMLLFHMKTDDSYAIELGRPLDDLHDNNPDLVKYYRTNRAGYLKKLGKEEVLALLCSDPSFFYTSSNHMLFDRLLSDFKGKSMVDVMKEYGLWGTPSGRNFIFRAMNYGRLYGSQNSMFSEKDMGAVMKELTTPLFQDGFEPNYFYLLANTIEHLDVAKKNYVRLQLAVAMSLVPKQAFPLSKAWAEQKYAAIAFLEDMIDNPQKRPVGKFDASKYKGTGEKLLIVQVFDKEDTEKTSWPSSQGWWSRYLKVQPKSGTDGELIYETKDVRMVLYMGNTPEDNQKFISNLLTEKKNAIITFRGHSYSLSENFPDNIFAPFPKSSILFMPGSCGSAGSIPGYLSSNQNIDIIGNTSTGDGYVTNTVMELLIEEARKGGKRGYNEIIASGAERIESVGGNAATLRAATWGDFLLKSVYGKGQR